MSIKRREYQNEFVRDIYNAWRHARVVAGILATGGGKTVCFSSIAHEHAGAVAAVVHRKEILGQISLAFGQLGVKHRVIAPDATVAHIRRRHLDKLGKCFIDQTALAGVVSVQTLTAASAAKRRDLQAWVAQVTLAIFDEAHHYIREGRWGRAVETFANAKQLHVTATPERADGKGLGAHAEGFIEQMILGPSASWLIEQGYLSPYKYFAPPSDLNVAGIARTKDGDLNMRALRARVVESHLVGDVVEHYTKRLMGKRAVVFATDVATCHDIEGAFAAHGIEAAALSGETETGMRDRTIDKFERGEIKVLINCELFDEGFDVPGVDGVILARPTESLGKFLQMVGRALRTVYGGGFDLSTVDGRKAAITAGPKPHAIIIDAVRNWERHGLPSWPRQWTLDGTAGGGRGGGAAALRTCAACTQPYPRALGKCPRPDCGAEWAPAERSTPEQVDGDLNELDVGALDALFRKLDAANISDDAFMRQQIAKGVPPQGRSRLLQRHQTVKTLRAVLDNLIAWWWGAQPHRDKAELQRRFYLRFGVDVITAKTLTIDETETLINAIVSKFNEDVIDG